MLFRSFALLWAQGSRCDELVAILCTVHKVVAAVLTAAEQSNILHLLCTNEERLTEDSEGANERLDSSERVDGVAYVRVA